MEVTRARREGSNKKAGLRLELREGALMSYLRKSWLLLSLLAAVAGFSLLLEEAVRAQTTGPVTTGPRRPDMHR